MGISLTHNWGWNFKFQVKLIIIQHGGYVMSIHQISVNYVDVEDRILLRLRTVDGLLYEAWLTRRLMTRLLQPLQQAITSMTLAEVAKEAIVMPEARDMLLASAQERNRQQADFKTPFNEEVREDAKPMGAQPMLISGVELAVRQPPTLCMLLRDNLNRSMTLEFPEALASNVFSLMMAAVAQSEWGLVNVREAPIGVSEQELETRVLN